MNKLLLLIVLMVFSIGAMCPTAGGGPVNFQDGTWSTCTYSKPDGTKFTAPLQLGGAPLEFSQPDGTSVKCSMIPVLTVPE